MNGSRPSLETEDPHNASDEPATGGAAGGGGQRLAERVQGRRRDAREPALEVSGSGFIEDSPVALAVAHRVTSARCTASARANTQDSHGASDL